MKGKRKAWVLAGAAAYILLLAALTAAEVSCGHSDIQSFGDALWYSLVTLTTVGYGDLVPATPLGRAIGGVFLLMSVGLLACVIGAAYQLLTGRFWPEVRLYAARKREWFVFSQINDASVALAEDLAKAYPKGVMVFCRDNAKTDVQRGWIVTGRNVKEAARLFAVKGVRRTVFLIAQDELLNSDDAHALRKEDVAVYCCAQEDGALNDVSYFQPQTCCARRYWREYPITGTEKHIVMVGDGRYAQALLSCAAVVNCREPLHAASYHLFGDWQAYRREHYRLVQEMSSDTGDALCFHEQAWNEDAALLESADRIIFCTDDEDENARCAQLLARRYACSAQVDVRTDHVSSPGRRFGGIRELYTGELVMRTELDALARRMHAIYCSSAGNGAVPWEALSPFLKDSNRAAADHAVTKLRLLLGDEARWSAQSCALAAERYREQYPQRKELFRQIEHARWMRFYSLHNWRYDAQRCDEKRRHPCLLPYDRLSEAEQAKDDYAWRQLEQLAQDAQMDAQKRERA